METTMKINQVLAKRKKRGRERIMMNVKRWKIRSKTLLLDKKNRTRFCTYSTDLQNYLQEF